MNRERLASDPLYKRKLAHKVVDGLGLMDADDYSEISLSWFQKGGLLKGLIIDYQGDVEAALKSSKKMIAYLQRDIQEADANDTLGLMLKTTNVEPLLSFEEEIELGRLMEEGKVASNNVQLSAEDTNLQKAILSAEWARNIMWLANTRLVFSIAKKYKNSLGAAEFAVEDGLVELNRADEIEEKLPQELIEVLQKYGIEGDLPVEVLNEVYENWLAREVSIEEPESIVTEVIAKKTDRDKEEIVISLPPRMYQSARVSFRLANDISKPVAARDVVQELLGEEIAKEGGDYKKVYYRLSANYTAVRLRISDVLMLIDPEKPDEVTFPIQSELLESFLYSSVIDNNVYDIFERLNNIPVYNGLSFKQILDFLHDNRFEAINLSGADPVEKVKVIEPREEIIGKWTNSERWYFACKLYKKQPWLGHEDRNNLRQIIDKYDDQLRDIEDWRHVKSGLEKRLYAYLRMSKEEKNEIWELEDEETQFLLAILVRGKIDTSSFDKLLE